VINNIGTSFEVTGNHRVLKTVQLIAFVFALS